MQAEVFERRSVRGLTATALLVALAALPAAATGDTGMVGGDVKVVKTVSGAYPMADLSFRFELRSGASTTAAGTLVGSAVANISTYFHAYVARDIPFGVYQLCEVDLGSWNSSLSAEEGFHPARADGTPDTGAVCINIFVEYPWVHLFNVDNTPREEPPPPPPPPSTGPAHTIGYWKNWSSCSGGTQDAMLDNTLASFSGGGVSIGNVFVDTCEEAARILSKSDLNGWKRATDPAYRLAAQLLGARLNVQANAVSCETVHMAISNAQALLTGVGFNGVDGYRDVVDGESADMLADMLDDYNNGGLCQ